LLITNVLAPLAFFGVRRHPPYVVTPS
jgi:hypothetical protein